MPEGYYKVNTRNSGYTNAERNRVEDKKIVGVDDSRKYFYCNFHHRHNAIPIVL